MKPTLYIVIPCYNEQEVLPVTAPLFLQQLTSMQDAGLVAEDSRILLVNDGSKDDTWAIIRRLLHGKSPFSPDRGHLHHKLIDLGFTQKEAVGIIYALCGLLGLVALTFTDTMFKETRFIKSLVLVGVAILIFAINFLIMKNPSARYLSGIFDPNDIPPEHLSPAKKAQMELPLDEPAASDTDGDDTI